MSGPAPDWQRPPWPPSNHAAEVHGAYSERRIGPRAAQIVADLLAAPSTPDWIREPQFAPARAAYGRALAVVEALVEFLDTQDIQAALSEFHSSLETEERGKTRTTRRTAGKRVTSALAALDRAESRLATQIDRLGLSPAAFARVTKDLSQSRWYQGKSALDVALDRIEEERRQAIEAGGDG